MSIVLLNLLIFLEGKPPEAVLSSYTMPTKKTKTP